MCCRQVGNNPPPNPLWNAVSSGSPSTWTNSPLTFNQACYVQNTTVLINPSATYPCNAVGRYITVQQLYSALDNAPPNGGGCLNLCAFFAYGTQAASPPPFPPLPPVPPFPPATSGVSPVQGLVGWYDLASFNNVTSTWTSKVNQSNAITLVGPALALTSDAPGTTGSTAQLSYISGAAAPR